MSETRKQQGSHLGLWGGGAEWHQRRVQWHGEAPLRQRVRLGGGARGGWQNAAGGGWQVGGGGSAGEARSHSQC